MKTIRPIKIEQKKNETLHNVCKRSIDNAFVNGTLVEMIYQGISLLVYPMDNIMKLMKTAKIKEIQHRLETLKAV